MSTSPFFDSNIIRNDCLLFIYWHAALCTFANNLTCMFFWSWPKGSVHRRATWKQQVGAIRFSGSEQDLFTVFRLSGKHLACYHPGFLQNKGLFQHLKWVSHLQTLAWGPSEHSIKGVRPGCANITASLPLSQRTQTSKISLFFFKINWWSTVFQYKVIKMPVAQTQNTTAYSSYLTINWCIFIWRFY